MGGGGGRTFRGDGGAEAKGRHSCHHRGVCAADAGHEPSSRMTVRREQGGPRVRVHHCMWSASGILLGIPMVLGCSTHLEWLAKLLALLLLRTYEGCAHMLCYNTAVQVFGLTRSVRCHSWMDRLAKYVLALSVVRVLAAGSA